MFTFSDEQLAVATGMPIARAVRWGDPLRKSMAANLIHTPRRAALFLAQVSHESLAFSRTEENLLYSATRLEEVFGRYFNKQSSIAYARQPERIANRVYASRNGNGSEQSGDGWLYRGRGPMQHTGRRNYQRMGILLGLPLVEKPQLLLEVEHGAAAASAYWRDEGLNGLADQLDTLGVSRKINLGDARSSRTPNGMQDRLARSTRAMKAFGAR